MRIVYYQYDIYICPEVAIYIYIIWLQVFNSTILFSYAAEWEEVSSGGGLDQYNPFLPHARSLHAGAPLSPDTFAIVGGCAAWVLYIYSIVIITLSR